MPLLWPAGGGGTGDAGDIGNNLSGITGIRTDVADNRQCGFCFCLGRRQGPGDNVAGAVQIAGADCCIGHLVGPADAVIDICRRIVLDDRQGRIGRMKENFNGLFNLAAFLKIRQMGPPGNGRSNAKSDFSPGDRATWLFLTVISDAITMWYFRCKQRCFKRSLYGHKF